jgi:DNA-directed RNA polymerase subunit RPC12/RpoP
MVRKCPKCGKESDDDAVYCPNCGFGLTLYARTSMLSSAGVLLVGAAAGALVFLILSIIALFNVYQWYPAFVAQEWFLYDLLFAVFAFAESVFGVVASVLTFLRLHYRFAFAAAFCCLISGTGLLTTSLIQPLAVLWQSLLLYFLPLFLPPLIAMLLVYYRNAEFN